MEWVVKVLAVVGGAALGALVVGWLARWPGKWVGVRDYPRPVMRVIRLAGAVVVGWAVWIMVTAPGGLGLFGGGGSLFGGKGTEAGTSQETPGPGQLDKSPTNSTPSQTSDKVQIEMLGGARYQEGSQRFYLIEGDPSPRSLTEVIEAIKERRRQNPNIKFVEIIIYDRGSVAESHPAVSKLEKSVRELDLIVKMRKPGTDAP
jgi:hypothetical protein